MVLIDKPLCPYHMDACSIDPIFAVIERHRKLERLWSVLEDAHDRDTDMDCADVESAFSAAQAAADQLAKTVPTTLEGVSALLDYIETKQGCCEEDRWCTGAMSSATVALARLSSGPEPELLG